MNREDIIRTAREAGVYSGANEMVFAASLERFAALVAAHIRETEFKPDWNNYRQGFADGAAEEREACAKVVEDTKEWKGGGWVSTLCQHTKRAIAAAIRARRQK